MGKPQLRPIGSEFTQDLPPDIMRADTNFTGKGQRYTWRVIAHRKVIGLDWQPAVAEEVELVKIEETEGA